MRLNAKQIIQYTGGEYLIEPIDASALFTGITWDSRDVQQDWLYVALPGERVDGLDFVEAALSAGARGALVMERPADKACVLAREMGCSIIQVPNTYHAITDLAREWRKHLHGKVVGLTGSVGKTTTKNLLRDVCSAGFSTVATAANQNNELGVPKTILNADPDTQAVIVEMGMRGLGQIAELTDIARPDWGVITNVGTSHMELLGSQENIARAKAELLEALPSGTGRAFLNGQDAYTPFLAEVSTLDARHIPVCLYDSGAAGTQGDGDNGLVEQADRRCACDLHAHSTTPDAAQSTWAENVTLDAEGRPAFDICFRGFRSDGNAAPTLFDMEPDTERVPVKLALRGEHNVGNALAAAAVGRALGIAPQAIADALSESVAEAGRQEMLRSREGCLIINDAYNASPDSMRASLALLASLETLGTRYAVLGDMGELGETSDACHRGVGEAVAAHGIHQLVCVGQASRLIAEGAEAAGMDGARITCVDSIGSALEHLEGTLGPDDVVLVKASNFMGLARLAEGLAS